MHVVQIVEENDIIWTWKDAVYRCVCGHTETQEQMDKRFKINPVVKYLKRNEKYMNNEDSLENNPFKDALKT